MFRPCIVRLRAWQDFKVKCFGVYPKTLACRATIFVNSIELGKMVAWQTTEASKGLEIFVVTLGSSFDNASMNPDSRLITPAI